MKLIDNFGELHREESLPLNLFATSNRDGWFTNLTDEERSLGSSELRKYVLNEYKQGRFSSLLDWYYIYTSYIHYKNSKLAFDCTDLSTNEKIIFSIKSNQKLFWKV